MLRRDASGKFADFTAPVEFRADPLTGRSVRLEHFDLSRVIRPDIDALERRSLEMFCPFCPPHFEDVTSRFTPDFLEEGFIRVGEAFAFPNINPYDMYGLVVVLSPHRHFIRLGEFDKDIIANGLAAARTFLARVCEVDATGVHGFIAWNYLPPSGGSLVHPHLQANAGRYPVFTHRQEIEASAAYFSSKGTNYWSDLVEQEKRSGERYLGRIGDTEWLTAFAPMGRLGDVMTVFPGKASILDLTDDDLRDFAGGLLKFFRFIDGKDLCSFNMSFYSGFDSNNFWVHARITPRSMSLYSPMETSDQAYFQLLQQENVCIFHPEEMAGLLKDSFSR
jgi:UDPglucose--hexose-1-phosphate uridylyltransferase